MENWERAMWFEETGCLGCTLSKHADAPTATVYAGMCLLEATNVSEGRGTTVLSSSSAPVDLRRGVRRGFEQTEATGVFFRETYFQPTFQKYAGEICAGTTPRARSRSFPSLNRREDYSSHSEPLRRSFQWKPPPTNTNTSASIEVLIGGPVRSLFFE
jgi:hypothetical protein